MKKIIFISLITAFAFSGCDIKNDSKYELNNTNTKTYLLNKENGEVFYIDNKTMYKVVMETETKNKIGEILTVNSDLLHSKVFMQTKIYNDSVYYKIELSYLPIIKEVQDENDSTRKIKKDVSVVSFEDWKQIIINRNANYAFSLVFLDSDNFTVVTKDIPLKFISVNQNNSIIYEGSFEIDKSLATKINQLSFYYIYPELNEFLNKSKN